MKRSERKIYCKCIAIMAVYIISAVYFYSMPSQAHTAQIAENVPYLDETVSGEEFTAEPSETPKNGKIRENTHMSAMPCEDPEAFERWLETYEQETSEETEIQTQDSGALYEVSYPETEAGQEIDASCYKVFTVNGETLNPELQAYLYQRLSDYQLEWFMPYAIMIAYQESKFDIYAVNPTNHVDCGLFQFRSYYYPGQDIFNPYEQIDIFCQQMANRSQYDVYEMISRHNVSDWGSYNATYVSQVLAHEANLREVN